MKHILHIGVLRENSYLRRVVVATVVRGQYECVEIKELNALFKDSSS